MPRLSADSLPTLPVCISNLVSNRCQVVHDRLAVAENGLEHFLGVSVGAEIQLFLTQGPQLCRVELTRSELVGLLGFEPRTKGFTLTGRFPLRVDYLFTRSS